MDEVEISANVDEDGNVEWEITKDMVPLDVVLDITLDTAAAIIIRIARVLTSTEMTIDDIEDAIVEATDELEAETADIEAETKMFLGGSATGEVLKAKDVKLPDAAPGS